METWVKLYVECMETGEHVPPLFPKNYVPTQNWRSQFDKKCIFESETRPDLVICVPYFIKNAALKIDCILAIVWSDKNKSECFDVIPPPKKFILFCKLSLHLTWASRGKPKWIREWAPREQLEQHWKGVGRMDMVKQLCASFLWKENRKRCLSLFF